MTMKLCAILLLVTIQLSEQYGTKGGTLSGSFSSSSSSSQSSSSSSSSSGSFSVTGSLDKNTPDIKHYFANLNNNGGAGNNLGVGGGIGVSSGKTLGPDGTICSISDSKCLNKYPVGGGVSLEPLPLSPVNQNGAISTSGSSAGALNSNLLPPKNEYLGTNYYSGATGGTYAYKPTSGATSSGSYNTVPVSTGGSYNTGHDFISSGKHHNGVSGSTSGGNYNTGSYKPIPTPTYNTNYNSVPVSTSDSVSNVKKPCCKGPFPGPSGSIYESKPASSVPPVPSPYPLYTGGALGVQPPSFIHKPSYSHGTGTGTETSSQDKKSCCKGPFPGPSGSIHDFIPAHPGMASWNRPVVYGKTPDSSNGFPFGTFGTSSLNEKSDTSSYSNGPSPNSINHGVTSNGNSNGPESDGTVYNQKPSTDNSYATGSVTIHKNDNQGPSTYGSSSNSGSTSNIPKPDDSIYYQKPNIDNSYATGSVTTHKNNNQGNAPQFSDNYHKSPGTYGSSSASSISGSSQNSPKPDDSVYYQKPNIGNSFTTGSATIDKYDQGSAPQLSDSYHRTTGTYGGSSVSANSGSNPKPDDSIYYQKPTIGNSYATGSVTIGKDNNQGSAPQFSDNYHKPTGTYGSSSSSSNSNSNSNIPKGDGLVYDQKPSIDNSYSTGSVTIHKDDGSVSPGDHHKLSGTYGTSSASANSNYGSIPNIVKPVDNDFQKPGFATGSVSIYKDDGTISHGQFGDKPSGSYGSSSALSNTNYGGNSNNGFATGSVNIHKDDGTISHGQNQDSGSTNPGSSYGNYAGDKFYKPNLNGAFGSAYGGGYQSFPPYGTNNFGYGGSFAGASSSAGASSGAGVIPGVKNSAGLSKQGAFAGSFGSSSAASSQASAQSFAGASFFIPSDHGGSY